MKTVLYTIALELFALGGMYLIYLIATWAQR